MTRRPAIERVLFVYAPLAFALVFLLGPFYWMVITALKPNSELYNAARSPLYVATRRSSTSSSSSGRRRSWSGPRTR